MSLTEIMSHSGLSGYAIVGLVLFMAAFVAIVVRLFLPSRRSELDRAARLPIDDEPGTPGGRSE